MDLRLFIRSTRCRLPLRHTPLHRHYATALAHKKTVSANTHHHNTGSTDRPPHPTAHRTTSEHTQSQPVQNKFLKAGQIRKAKVAQAMEARTEGMALSNEQMLKELDTVAAMEALAPFDVWAKAIENLGA